MTRAFFIVGPTATGKSELAAEVAAVVGAEIVSADAFQIYRGLDLLTAKPEAATLRKAPHHLIGTFSLEEEMNAEKFRTEALRAIAKIRSRGKYPIVVGGSGLYVRTLTHGLSTLPASNRKLRDELNELDLDQLHARLLDLDRKTASAIDVKNRRRLVRALEICLLTGEPASAQRTQWEEKTAAETAAATIGVLVFRDREELYQRINRRVEAMFKNGVVDEIRTVGAISPTAAQTIGWREIREYLDGKIAMSRCIAQIQQFTRRYAKRQLTWFRRQSNLEPLNLSLLSDGQAVKWVTQRVSLFREQG
jgi:tRNA dimethylallyltransferase